jgi:NodT family efflux transporter outer membrane factor (OMF) lipoprotein
VIMATTDGAKPARANPSCRHGWRRALLAVATTCLLAGCVSTPLPDIRVDLPAQWRQAGIDATRSDNAQATPAPESREWWKAFSDPNLDALVDEALAANLDLGQAQARLRAARALHAHADAPLRPNLHFRTSDPIDPDASASFLFAGFDSTWELGLFGRSEAIHRLARADLDTAQADVRVAQVSVTAEVAREWVELRSAQQREELLVAIRDARHTQFEKLLQRRKLGLASPQVVAQAAAALAQSEAALAEPRIATQFAAQALAVLLGRSEPDPDWLHVGELPRLREWRMTAAPADLLRTRPDIAHEQAAVLHAAGELGISRADRYPSIEIGGSIVWSTSEIEARPTNTNSIAALGPIIDIPLFDWGMRKAQADAKGDLLQVAALAYRKTVLTAVAEVETALGALEQQRLREQANSQAWQALDEVARHSRQRRQLGLANALDIAAADVDRDQAGLQLLDASSARALDYIALGKSLGGASMTAVEPPAASANTGRDR